MSSLCARTLAAVLALCPVSAWAGCTEEEGFLFSCEAGSPEKSLMICGQSEGDGTDLRWTTARVVYTGEKGEELSYPADPKTGPAMLYFSHLFRNDLYEAAVRFEKEGATYRLLFKDAPDSGDPETVSGPDAWLEMAKDGVTTEIARCSEAPFGYYDQMRVTLACDQQNPYGSAGCSDRPPNVK